MKHSKFISVVIATLLLFCSADAFAQRSRGGKGSGGRTQGYSRSASKTLSPRSMLRNVSYPNSGCCVRSYESYRLSGEPITSIAPQRSPGVTKPTPKPTAVYFSTNDVLNSSCTNFGFEVSKRKATKESLLVSRQAGDFYYRDGIFFSPSKENGNKYERSVITEPGKGYKSGNPSIKSWIVKKDVIDDLLELHSENKIKNNVRIAYQTPIDVKWDHEKEEISKICPYTFEDALIMTNLELFRQNGLKKMGAITTIANILKDSDSAAKFQSKIFKQLDHNSSFQKADFANRLLYSENFEELKTPAYIQEGLEWLKEYLNKNGLDNGK